MRVLVLENDFSVQSQIRTAYAGNTIEFATNAMQCKALLKYAQWDALLLGCFYTADATAVAEWLQTNSSSRPDMVIVYVANPALAADIKSFLPRAHYVPYAYTKNVLGGV